MITEGVLSTYKLYSSWANHRIKIEGYGSVNRIECTYNMNIEGTLVSLKRGFNTTYLFIADEPVIDHDNIVGFDKYFFHEGIFADSIADGRCWFISRATHHDNFISTNHEGVFTKCEHIRGLIV